MSKHTPGPWWLSPARNALGVVLGGPARPMHHGGTTVGQIASACSEALKAFTDAQESKRDAIGNAAIAAAIGDLVLAEEKARSAIAKAEGGAA
jgi:hypothetical protein